MPSLMSKVEVVELEEEVSELLGEGGKALKLIVKSASCGVSKTDPVSLIKVS